MLLFKKERFLTLGSSAVSVMLYFDNRSSSERCFEQYWLKNNVSHRSTGPAFVAVKCSLFGFLESKIERSWWTNGNFRHKKITQIRKSTWHKQKLDFNKDYLFDYLCNK